MNPQSSLTTSSYSPEVLPRASFRLLIEGRLCSYLQLPCEIQQWEWQTKLSNSNHSKSQVIEVKRKKAQPKMCIINNIIYMRHVYHTSWVFHVYSSKGTHHITFPQIPWSGGSIVPARLRAFKLDQLLLANPNHSFQPTYWYMFSVPTDWLWWS